jgi:hypothetical protein
MEHLENRAFRQLLACAQAAASADGEDAWSVMSTGERLAVALVLNRHDWLTRMNYTMADAIGRVGPAWVNEIPAVAQAING